MRFVTINIGCDWAGCTTVGPEGEEIVDEMTIAVDRKAPRTFGICKAHRAELEEILVPMLARGVTDKNAGNGTEKTAKRSSASGTPTVDRDTIVVCRVSGCGRDDIKGNVGLAQHLKKSHGGMTVAQHNELPEVT